MQEVQYRGFETKPELLERFKQMEPDLWKELGRWRDRSEVALRLLDQDRVELTIQCSANGVEGVDSDISGIAEVSQPVYFARWARFVWQNVLGKMMDQRVREYEKELSEVGG
jgi:hypothetical protein